MICRFCYMVVVSWKRNFKRGRLKCAVVNWCGHWVHCSLRVRCAGRCCSYSLRVLPLQRYRRRGQRATGVREWGWGGQGRRSSWWRWVSPCTNFLIYLFSLSHQFWMVHAILKKIVFIHQVYYDKSSHKNQNNPLKFHYLWFSFFLASG